MQAKDVMTTGVLTVTPETSVPDIAMVMGGNQISAVPVLGANGELAGIVSEGDLLHREETGTGRRHSWWLRMFGEREQRATEYIKSHGRHAKDVMSRQVVTVAEDTPLGDVAELLERRQIKRVPVVTDGRLVGIVSRANIVQALAVKSRNDEPAVDQDDRLIREHILSVIRDEIKLSTTTLSVIVEGGVVHLWGAVDDLTEKHAVEVAAENAKGVKKVESRLSLMSDLFRAGI